LFFIKKKIEIINLKVSLVNIVIMSENDESDYSDSDSEVELQQSKNLEKKKLIYPVNAAKKYGNYVEDSESDIDDSEPDNEDDADEEMEQTGGVKILRFGDVDFDDEEQKEDVKDDEEQKEEDDDDDDDDIEIDEEEGVVIEKDNKSKSAKSTKTVPIIIEEQDDEYDDDEYDENYLQKFDLDLNKNYITEFHPECLNHNYDEVLRLSRVIRNNSNVIIDPLHKTLPYLTKYEKARILGQRAKQIETGSKPFVKVPENIIDGYVIAELELKEKKIPFIIKRPIPGGAFEYWKLNDLENINF
jgi:DNA-directed RNA polymerase subunit K/omega